MIRKGDWKLLEFFESGTFELYDLKNDIGEASDLSLSEPEKLEELKQELHRWHEAIEADIPTELNPEFEEKEERKAVEKELARG